MPTNRHLLPRALPARKHRAFGVNKQVNMRIKVGAGGMLDNKQFAESLNGHAGG